MHAVVTGASGFLGSWTVRALIAAGHDVTPIARSSSPWRLDGAGVEVRAAEPQRWPHLVSTARADVLVMADWSGVTSAARADAAQWANVERHAALVDAAIDAGAQRILGLGSQAEYARQDRPIAETDPLEPTTVYGEAKAADAAQLESLCSAAGIEWMWARVFSVYGPLDNDGVVLERVAAALLSDEAVALSSGAQAWSMLFASDAGRAIEFVARLGAGTGPINIAHPEAPPLRDSIETFASVFDGSRALGFGDDAGPSLQADTTMIESLGWGPAIAHAVGLRLAADWYRGRAVSDQVTGAVLPARPTATSSR